MTSGGRKSGRPLRVCHADDVCEFWAHHLVQRADDDLRYFDRVADVGRLLGSSYCWFSSRRCVVHRGDERDVFVAGTLIGSFRLGDRRNAILIGLLSDNAVRVGKLAAAFGLVPETLRLLRKVHEKEGFGAVVAREYGGSESKITPRLRARLHAMFEAGLGATAVQRELRGRLSLRTVTYALTAWRAPAAAASTPVEPPTSEQMVIALENVVSVADNDTAEQEDKGNANTSVEEGVGDETISATVPRAGRFVQHLGAWLMLASVARLGVHRCADEARGNRVKEDAIRVAIDGVVCAVDRRGLHSRSSTRRRRERRCSSTRRRTA